MPAALHATGPRKPRSSGRGEKSPSKSSSCTSADSRSEESAGVAGASVLLTCASRIGLLRWGRETQVSSLRVIPRSALHSERYDDRSPPVNDHAPESPEQAQIPALKLSLNVASD